ncbi:mechanosensitive ion channel family protein [Butyricimonas virosa]|jgi:small conductance mechanosensitive channel|uniref:Mechanosensitive ion channel n=1 Tax=Butyricimonas virosa TaxID=544645 RepID=A0A413IK28_9BACT|nr:MULTISPECIES: mechanosensitive ion channel domain-containing protein [Butyricimonas]MBO4959412.1 mechanosensitive ion channel [Butyricimonas sp.]MCI6414821.1 mechanosensitive ion channel [Butyricimonas virosa]MCI7293901.1 mechanosensitive ion channel [Butyricimonas virosa]MDY5488692.1 mechanosensitive ion channel [Butyricimonas virosa]MDY6219385.1 mechanosensitive ion channel [Butyricimonas virosa]
MEELLTSPSNVSLDVFLTKMIDLGISVGSKILLAIVVFLVGRWIVRRLNKLLAKILEKRHVEASLSTFVKSLVNITLTLLLIIVVIGVLGIETSSFIALFASAGVAIGMALSGTLQNFAGGVMILLFKPFKVGDTIEAQGQTGTVREIQIFNTILATPDNKIIIIPNGGLSTGLMKNYSKEATRRVDWEFGIAYGDDYTKAKAVIARLLDADGRVLKDPAYFIALTSLGESSVNIVVRAWVNAGDYWGVYFDMNEKVYKTFAEENLNIPFPQLDVHLLGKTE